MQQPYRIWMICALFIVLLGGFVAYQHIYPARDSAANLWFPAPQPQERLAADTKTIKTWDVRLEDTPYPDEPRGTLFEWKSADGTMQCAAGFVYSFGSHAFSNQNHLEFWCRETKLKPLEFTALPRPLPDFPQSNVSNIHGELYDYLSHRVYNFSTQQWQEITPQEWAVLGQSIPYAFQYVNETPFVMSYNYRTCKGLSLFSPHGYLGTIAIEEGSPISTIIWRDAIFLNANWQAWRADLPTDIQPMDGTCHMIPHRVVSDSTDWAYMFFPFQDSLYYGGTGTATNGRKGCAKIYRWDGNAQRFTPQPTYMNGAPCDGHHITEYYSYTPYGDGGFVGNFPHGALVKHNAKRAELTPLAAPTQEEFHYKKPHLLPRISNGGFCLWASICRHVSMGGIFSNHPP